MSGLFGIIDLRGKTEPDLYLHKAVEQLSHRPWYVNDTWQEGGTPVGLGRIGIGIFNREKQPVVSADGRYVLFMSGEFYRTDTIRQRLDEAGVRLRDTSDPELALSAFLAFGDDFAKDLEGTFFILVYDCNRQRLVITNDRFGLYPHYYHVENGRFVIAPEVKGVLCAPFVDKKLNVTALAEYMRFQQLLGVKTFHEGIQLFPYASVGVFDLRSGDWTLRRYWGWDQIPDRPDVSLEEGAKELGRLLRQAVERRCGLDDLRTGVFLSGGLDSRMLLSLIPSSKGPVVSATFGAANCRDVYYAQRIASAVGSRHYWFDLADGNWILDNVDLHLKLTEGFHNWLHMHGITMLPNLRDVIDYNFTGWAVEFPLGYPGLARTKLNNPVDRYSLIEALFEEFTQKHTWPGLSESEARSLFTSDYETQIANVAFQSLIRELEPYWRFPTRNRADYFFIENHCMRLTLHMNTIARSHLEVRFPYWDYEFIDLAYSLNPDYRMGEPRGKLYLQLLTHVAPHLARIPYDKDEFLPTSNLRQRRIHALSVRARRRLGLLPQRATLYADYENYLRHELRGWAESILFDGQLEQRGIFNMDVVRSLFERHMSGREQWTIGKIAPIMTFEMMMREYFG